MKHIALALLCISCGEPFAAGLFSRSDGGADADRADARIVLVDSVDSGGSSVSLSDGGEDAPLEASTGGSLQDGSAGSGGASSGGTIGSGGAVEVSGGSGGDPDECAAGSVQCVGAQRQKCISGSWLDNGAPCPGWCLDGTCTACKPDARSCATDTRLQTCDATGAWALGAACVGPKPSCSDGVCFGLCCRGGSFSTPCDEANPWLCYQGTTPAGDCASSDQCSGVCIVPGGYQGTVERCP